jgi:hypothetical protein
MHNNIYNDDWKIPAPRQQFSVRGTIWANRAPAQFRGNIAWPYPKTVHTSHTTSFPNWRVNPPLDPIASYTTFSHHTFPNCWSAN